jgi:predicted DNA-binding protein
VYELLKPEKTGDCKRSQEKDDRLNTLLDRFSRDLSVVLKDSVEKALEHVRKEYEK